MLHRTYWFAVQSLSQNSSGMSVRHVCIREMSWASHEAKVTIDMGCVCVCVLSGTMQAFIAVYQARDLH